MRLSRLSVVGICLAFAAAASAGEAPSSPSKKSSSSTAPPSAATPSAEITSYPSTSGTEKSFSSLSDKLQGLQFRNIGPFRGGRVTAVTGAPGQPLTFYFGGTGGGVWKSTDGG